MIRYRRAESSNHFIRLKPISERSVSYGIEPFLSPALPEGVIHERPRGPEVPFCPHKPDKSVYYVDNIRRN